MESQPLHQRSAEPSRLRAAAAVAWNWDSPATGAASTPSPNAQRRHGALQSLIAGSIAAVLLLLGHGLFARIVGSIAAVNLLLALLSPLGLYAGLRRALAALGRILALIVSTVLLVPMFYLVFTLLRLGMRMGARNRMRGGRIPDRASYWQSRDAARGIDRFERQF